MAPASRRGFLRDLVGLPLIGGGLTIIGAPIAVAEPPTQLLMREYADWLVYEHHETMAEIVGQRNGASQQWKALFGRSWQWHRARGKIERDDDGLPIGDGLSFPSSRAALVLSTIGCDWRAAA